MNAWTLAITNLTTKTPPPPPSSGIAPKVCPACGKTFTPLTNHRSTTYCTKKCMGSAKAGREKAKRHARGLKKTRTVVNDLPQKQKIDFKRTWGSVFGADGKVRVPTEDQPWS